MLIYSWASTPGVSILKIFSPVLPPVSAHSFCCSLSGVCFLCVELTVPDSPRPNVIYPLVGTSCISPFVNVLPHRIDVILTPRLLDETHFCKISNPPATLQYRGPITTDNPNSMTLTFRDFSSTSRYSTCDNLWGLPDANFPAVCVSMDRFVQDTVPICCSPFDGIAAPVRHRLARPLASSRLGTRLSRSVSGL